MMNSDILNRSNEETKLKSIYQKDINCLLKVVKMRINWNSFIYSLSYSIQIIPD